MLAGGKSVQEVLETYPELEIVDVWQAIKSIDLGERIIVSETSEMLSYQAPTYWAVLPKAAFVVTGIIPEDTKLNLQDILKELGGGIDLTLFSAVPSGSGLGISSILGSAIIACLSRMIGQELTQEALFNRTLYMEQLMTTGGGWQDQIGGVVGGVKHIQTVPGLFQVPRISWTALKIRPNIDLSEKFLLYYTGYRRMAKNILRNIVGRYLDRDAVTLKAISQLREISFEMKEQLDHRNISAFGKNIAEVWELNKTLDPGTSNMLRMLNAPSGGHQGAGLRKRHKDTKRGRCKQWQKQRRSHRLRQIRGGGPHGHVGQRKSWSCFPGRGSGRKRIIELSEGRVVIPDMPTDSHQYAVGELFAAIRSFVREQNLGQVRVAPLRVRLWPGKFREPDIVFIHRDHADRIGEEYWGVPNLIVEVISPRTPKSSDTEHVDRGEKFFEYARGGVQEYWLVNPTSCTIEVYVLLDGVYHLLSRWGNGEVARSKVLNGLEVPVEAVIPGGE